MEDALSDIAQAAILIVIGIGAITGYMLAMGY